MNALLGLIKRANFDPRKFKRDDVTNGTEYVYNIYCTHFHKLELENTGVSFRIAVMWSEGARYFSTKQGLCTFSYDGPRVSSYGDWSRWAPDFGVVEKEFTGWLDSEGKKYFDYLADQEEEQATPDLWDELDVASADLSLLENTPFTEDEQARISHMLNKFLGEVEGRAFLSEDAFRLLQERVEYSIESSKRLSRKDWIMATTGALMGYVVQVGLTAPVANQLLQLAADALNWIWIARPLLSP